MTKSLPLDADLLKDLRVRAEAFIKLDLGYLAAAGAVVTLLKFGRHELIEVGAKTYLIPIAMLVLITIDVTIESIIFKDWIAARTGSIKRAPAGAIKILLGIQPILHSVFVTGLISFATGFSVGTDSSLTRLSFKADIQVAADAFVKDKSRPPNNLQELKQASISVKHAVEQLNGEQVAITPTGPKSYKLTFGGGDKSLGTEDDWNITEEVSLDLFLQRMEKRRKTATE